MHRSFWLQQALASTPMIKPASVLLTGAALLALLIDLGSRCSGISCRCGVHAGIVGPVLRALK